LLNIRKGEDMKIHEITSAEEQLGLLRIIIDNTWGAIKQQAEAERLQKANKPKSKPAYKNPKQHPIPQPKVAIPKSASPIQNKNQKTTQQQMPIPKPTIQPTQYTQQKIINKPELGFEPNEKLATKNYGEVLKKSPT
jgi:hypothetical protein